MQFFNQTKRKKEKNKRKEKKKRKEIKVSQLKITMHL